MIVNDHVAFRTFNDPRIGIDVLAAPFVRSGYEAKADYVFPAKKLRARHFENPSDPGSPRVFISELLLEEFSPFLHETIMSRIDSIHPDLLRSDELIYSGNVWETPAFETYNRLREESEYAGWLYIYGFCANHFTVSVNELQKFDTLQKVNRFLKDNGFMINDSGGEIKGSPEQLLEQSSIRADHVTVSFKEDTFQVPGCYSEFAKRYADKNGNLFSGFIAGSADKIFESTDFYKKKKK